MAPTLPDGATKAKGMEVYVSGFSGVHPIQTGVAYWYRGHYIYSKAGIPVEPIPFATKKGIHIVGTTVETAPPLRTGYGHEERDESEVAALYRSMLHTWEEQEKEKEKDSAIEARAFEVQKGEIEGLKSTDQAWSAAQGLGSAKMRRGPFRLEVARDKAERHYNDRAMFLAESAPVSHWATPAPSRSNTPKPWLSRASSPAQLRAIPSTSRMQTLDDRRPVIEGVLTLQEKQPELLNPVAVNTYMNTWNNAGSQLPYHHKLRAPNCIFLAALAESKPQITLNAPSRNASIHKDIPGPSMRDLVQAREAKTRIGRTRSGSMEFASLAMNAAFNEYHRCSVHGGDCDGVSVTNEHLTLQNRKIRGFKENYPAVVNKGRMMIDWYVLMQEERDSGK